MQTLAPDSFCPLTNPQPYQRDGAQPPLWERGCATVENTLIKIDIDAQRQRAVGWSDWLGLDAASSQACTSSRRLQRTISNADNLMKGVCASLT
jgi:hypothetical protein